MLIVVFIYSYKILLDAIFPNILNDKSKIINQGEEKVQIKLFKNQCDIVEKVNIFISSGWTCLHIILFKDLNT